jgi:phosphoglycolate phosphatase
MYKYAFFDLDGTLTDSGPGIIDSAIVALSKFGIEVKDRKQLYPFIGPPLSESFRDLFGIPEDQVPLAIQYYREHYNVHSIFAGNSVYEGVEDVLIKLKEAGVKLVVATSKPYHLAKQVLDYFDLTKYFDYISGAVANVRIHKHEVIAHALKELNITNLDDVIMIGDRKYDVIGARQNGLKCIGILYGGYSTLEEFLLEETAYIISKPNEIIDIVLGE